jgi:hypothetical protein
MASLLNPMNDKRDEVPNNQLGAAPANQAKDAATSVVQTAEDAATYVGHKAEDATAAVGDGLKSLGNTLRAHSPHDGLVGDVSAAVASSLESTGRYLRDEGLQGMAEDVTGLIRRYPIPALLVAVGAGFLIARATTSRSQSS